VSAAASVVVVGSSNADLIVRVPALPGPGETVLGGRFARAAGGKGANQAVAAARAGAAVSFVACLGDDDLGRRAREGFEAEGIDASAVAIEPSQPTGVAFIFVDAKGENSIAVASGANSALSPAHLEAARETIESAAVLLLQLETPLETVAAAARMAADAGVRVVLDPAPACRLPDSLLARVSILTPNATEAAQLTGLEVADRRGAERAAAWLRERGVETVCVTLGRGGVVMAGPDGSFEVDAHGVEAVDATGAGDVFSGCMAAALAAGRPLVDALAFANAGAACSVTVEGAQPSAPKRPDVESQVARAGPARPITPQQETPR